MSAPKFSLHHLAWLVPVLFLSVPVSGRGPVQQTTNPVPPAQAQTPPRPEGQRGGGPRPGMSGPSEVGWEWWKDVEAVKEMGLAPEKTRQIDRYYNDRQRALKHFVDGYVKERDLLERMTRERVVDDDIYALQVSRVETLRSKLLESRTVMLYRMYRALTPEQYQKLREIYDRRSRRRGGGEAGAR